MEWLARCAKARMPLVGLLTLMILLVGGAPSAFAAPSMAGENARGAGSSGPQYTHHMTEKVPMSAALCAKYKAAFPARAADSQLCFFTHGVDWTDAEPNSPGDMPSPVAQAAHGKAAPGMAAALSCPSVHISYHDWQGSPLRWYMDLETTWYWYGDCAPPSLTRKVCYVEYTVAADITNQQCYTYLYPATSPNRRAAVYSGHIIEHDPGFDITYDTWQRRECFNTGTSSCYWTTQ